MNVDEESICCVSAREYLRPTTDTWIQSTHNTHVLDQIKALAPTTRISQYQPGCIARSDRDWCNRPYTLQERAMELIIQILKRS